MLGGRVGGALLADAARSERQDEQQDPEDEGVGGDEPDQRQRAGPGEMISAMPKSSDARRSAPSTIRCE
jgi:hypothetical protein